jgi:hypothetical protein
MFLINLSVLCAYEVAKIKHVNVLIPVDIIDLVNDCRILYKNNVHISVRIDNNYKHVARMICYESNQNSKELIEIARALHNLIENIHNDKQDNKITDIVIYRPISEFYYRSDAYSHISVEMKIRYVIDESHINRGFEFGTIY